jgi:hypothetical protein
MRAPAGIVSGIGRDGGRTHFSGTFGRSTVGRPESLVQCSRKRRRPHRRTVSGATITRVPLHAVRAERSTACLPDEVLAKPLAVPSV